jgi:hypothetical protein
MTYKQGTNIKLKTTPKGIEARYTAADIVRIGLTFFGFYCLLYFAIQVA